MPHAPWYREVLLGPGRRRTRSAAVVGGCLPLELVDCESSLARPRPVGYRVGDEGLFDVAFTFGGVREWSPACRRLPRRRGAVGP